MLCVPETRRLQHQGSRKWLAVLLLCVLSCTLPSRKSESRKAADREALAALRRGLGPVEKIEGSGHFPYYMHVVGGYVILWKQAPEDWGLGEPDTLHDKIEEPDRLVSTAFKRIRLELLPEPLRTLPGRRLYLLDSSGLVCEARVAELLLLGQAYTLAYGYWKDPSDPLKHPTTRAEIAGGIWEDSNREGHNLGARVTPLSGACQDATWAQVAIGPPPQVVTADDPGPAWNKAVELQLQKPPWSTSITAIKKSFEERRSELARSGISEMAMEQVTGMQSVLMFPPKLSFGRLLFASFGHDGDGCISEPTWYWAAWTVSGTPEQPQFRELKAVGAEDTLMPLAVLDVDDDGRPEFLAREGLLGPSDRAPNVYDNRDFMFLPRSTSGDGCAGSPPLPAHP